MKTTQLAIAVSIASLFVANTSHAADTAALEAPAAASATPHGGAHPAPKGNGYGAGTRPSEGGAVSGGAPATAPNPAAPVTPAPAPEKNVNVALVDTMSTLAEGQRPGFRANHAKGIVVTGTFTPTAQAPSLSKARHFQKGVYPVIVRFSDATGVPTIADADSKSSPHGIAIRFQLPDKAYTDIVSISFNGFPVSTPEEFLAFLQAVQASGPNAAKPTPVEQFLATHPKALTFVKTPKPAPESFATLPFFGVNAFRFTNAKGEEHFARYRIIPVAGNHALTDAQAAQATPNYLMTELPARLSKGPVKFRLVAQLAQKGDTLTDGTAVWPDNRPQVELGVLSLTKAVSDSKAQEKKLAFNPLILVDGIAPSDDPILLARPVAYAVSVQRRMK